MKRFFATLLMLALAILPAHGDMLLTGVGSGNGSATPPLSFQFGASPAADASSTSHSFTSVAIGPATSDRIVLVFACASSSSFSLVTPTIGGVAATVVDNPFSSTLIPYSFYANVPTGTTATVAFGTSLARAMRIATYAIYNAQSPTPIDVKAGNSNPQTVTPTSQANGGFFGAGCAVAGGNVTLTNVTTDVSNQLVFGTTLLSTGSAATPSTSFSSQATFQNGTGSGGSYYGITFR